MSRGGCWCEQALHSQDASLLERCLNVSNPVIINNTAKRMAAIDAAMFLQAAVQRMQSRPARGQELHLWIRAVLLHHTAYLMSAPSASIAACDACCRLRVPCGLLFWLCKVVRGYT